MATITFEVAGNPTPKARPRLGRGNVYTPPETQAAEQLVGFACKMAAKSNRWPTREPVHVELEFLMGSKRRVDIDNLCKLILDGLNGVAWLDDTQVVSLTARKLFVKGRDPCTRISVAEVTHDE